MAPDANARKLAVQPSWRAAGAMVRGRRVTPRLIATSASCSGLPDKRRNFLRAGRGTRTAMSAVMRTLTFLGVLGALSITLAACGPDDDPQLAKDTCYEWCDDQHAHGCGEGENAAQCHQMCDNLAASMPEDCFGEWRVSLECQLEEQCSDELFLECADDAVDATECIQEEREASAAPL
jgi:hypothetical protein